VLSHYTRIDVLNSHLTPANQSLTLDSCRYESAIINDRFDRAQLLVRFVGNRHRVLELGCSTGYISRLLKQNGCSVIGVEVDLKAARLAANICDQVLVSDLDKSIWTEQIEERFDVVLMGDVLEHLVDPEEVLRSVRRLLLPSGVIVVSLPNIVHWSQRVNSLIGSFDYEPTGLLDRTHLHFYNLRGARTLIEDAGYRILEFQPIIGGRLSSYLRLLWQSMANILPNLFAYQFLFRAEPF
jgi:2-polyprenyl-3-methyl-5-hydroxy-6-metoxy-1,4-benzoquinol methylase